MLKVVTTKSKRKPIFAVYIPRVKIQKFNKGDLRDSINNQFSSESVKPIELVAKDSVSSSINTKEDRNSRIKAKIQSSANRLSSNNKDNYKSEGSSSKIDHYTQKSDINDTPSANDKNDNSSEIKKYLLNMSSNQSLNINKSELELISNDDYKNPAELELKDIQISSSSPPKIQV